MIERKLIGNQVIPIGRAVSYVRVSTDAQAAEDDTQRRVIENLAKEHGNVILQEFYDEGISGAKLETRTGFMAMREWLEAGRAEIVYTFSASRLSRPEDRKTAYRVLGLFAEHDVWTVTNSQVYAPGSDEFKSAIDEAGAENISRQENTLAGKVEKAIRFGHKSSGWATYGWVWRADEANKLGDWEVWNEDSDRWQIPERAEAEYGHYVTEPEDYVAIQLIWKRALENRGSAKICDELLDLGIRHRSVRLYDEWLEAKKAGVRLRRSTIPNEGKPWTRNNIDRILNNPYYATGWQEANLSRKARWRIQAGEEQAYTHVRFRLPKPPITEE